MMAIKNWWPYSPHLTTFIFSLILSIPAIGIHSSSFLRKKLPTLSQKQILFIPTAALINYLLICALADLFVVENIFQYAAEPVSNLSIILLYFALFCGICILQFELAISLPPKVSLLIAGQSFLILFAAQALMIIMLPFFFTHIRAIYYFW
jgi:hypothetical protein